MRRRTRHEDETEALIARIVEGLAEVPGIAAVAVGGSRARAAKRTLTPTSIWGSITPRRGLRKSRDCAPSRGNSERGGAQPP